MRQVSVAEAESRLGELVDEAQRGEQIEIIRDGKIVARLVAPSPAVRKPLDVEALRALTAGMTVPDESAADAVRQIRDGARY